jgi:hypothetical protein
MSSLSCDCWLDGKWLFKPQEPFWVGHVTPIEVAVVDEFEVENLQQCKNTKISLEHGVISW